MARTLPWAALPMLEAGGILYPVGMVLLVAERPRLWPRVFSYHEVFRILVIAGASGHFVVVAGCPVHLAGQAESCVAGPDRRRQALASVGAEGLRLSGRTDRGKGRKAPPGV